MANLDYQRLTRHLKALRLSGIISSLDEAINLAVKQKLPYLDFLEGLLAGEVQPDVTRPLAYYDLALPAAGRGGR